MRPLFVVVEVLPSDFDIFRYLYGHHAFIRHYVCSGGGKTTFTCVSVISDFSLLGFWFGDGWLYLHLSAGVIRSLRRETIFGMHLRFTCFLDALVSVWPWCYIACWAVGLARIVFGVFWVQDWWRMSGRAIVDCRYTFGRSEVTVTRLYKYKREVIYIIYIYISG
jgi:hypothetical protein